MSELKDLKTAEYQDLVNQGGVTVIDFWAPWCGYCVRMMPIFEALSEELGDKVVFAKVNTDEVVELAKEFKIEVLPTFAIIKNGEVVDRKIGYIPQNELKAAIEAQL